jgi:hypothetical protein
LSGEDLSGLAEQIDAVVEELATVRAGLRRDALARLTTEEQATLLAGLLERARVARRELDGVCAGLGGAALDRGAPPRMLDWADGRDVD